ncbi:nitroreductase family protein [Rhizobium tibeticum]|nr:nitroreductase family protein [Rhizobium tibeticum]
MAQLLAKRRTQYSLGKNIALPDEEIDALIREAVRLSPSAFNSQSSRVVS